VGERRLSPSITTEAARREAVEYMLDEILAKRR